MYICICTCTVFICAPCRAENPNVVKVYNKFRSKGFDILGVSLDRTKEDWMKAIEKDNLTWTQVSDLLLQAIFDMERNEKKKELKTAFVVDKTPV